MNLDIKKKYSLSKRNIVIILILILILIFQIKKRHNDLSEIIQKELLLKQANSEYVKLVNQIPVYRDTTFNIYISNISEELKIVFFKKHTITPTQKESNFFIHIYPKDKTLVEGLNRNFLALDFKADFNQFNYNNDVYYFTSRNLPDFEIEKINIGQYGFQGDNSISWQIKSLLEASYLSEIVNYNK